MDYRLAFWCLVTACAIRFLIGNRVYIGPDRKKYDAANFAILTRHLR